MEWLFDDERVDAKAGVRRVLGAPAKEREPILRPGAPWEEMVGAQRALFFDPEESKFRLWYRATIRAEDERPHDRDPVSSERAPRHRRTFLCYAESRDGVVWGRPDLGLFEFSNRRRNNILSEIGAGDGVTFNVVKDPADPDRSRRYKALGFENAVGATTIAGVAPGRKGVCVAYSADGLRWSAPRLIMDTDDLTDADCILPQREPTTGRWAGFFRPRTAPKRRFVGYSLRERRLRPLDVPPHAPRPRPWRRRMDGVLRPHRRRLRTLARGVALGVSQPPRFFAHDQ